MQAILFITIDTFSDLGTHTMDTTVADTTAPSTPSGLIASNTTQTSTDLAWSASTDNVAVSGYDVYQESTKIADNKNTNIFNKLANFNLFTNIDVKK